MSVDVELLVLDPHLAGRSKSAEAEDHIYRHKMTRMAAWRYLFVQECVYLLRMKRCLRIDFYIPPPERTFLALE